MSISLKFCRMTKNYKINVLNFSFCAFIILFTFACGSNSSDDDSNIQGSLNALSTCGRESGPLTIMPLGDSITESEQGQNSFRRPLWQLLSSAGCEVDFVGSRRGVSLGFRNSNQVTPPNSDFDLDHEGRWDYRVDEINSIISSSIETFRPSIILIHLGTNDVFQGQSVSSTVLEIENLIDTVRAIKADTAFVVSRVIPSSRNTDKIASLNNEISEISLKNTSLSPVVVVNQAAGYFVSDNYDGIHPGNSGEQKIAKTYFSAITSFSN